MSGRTQTIVAAACVALVLLAFSFVFIRGRRAELGAVRADIKAEEDRTQQLQAELARLEALQENEPRLRAQLEELRQFVPERDDVANFIFQVQRAADAAGVGFVQITPELPKPPPEGAPLGEVRAAIGAKGGYFAVQDFIRRLYDLDRAVRIDGLTLTGTEDAEQAADSGRIDVQLTSRIFFEPPAGAAAPADPATAGTAPTTTQPATTP
jgi:Tfp pilus assembly protein PilO